MTADPAVANELINREIGQIDKITALNIAREEGEAIGRTLGKAEGEAIGEARGKAEGKADEKRAIAKKMLLNKMPIEQIIEITGLSKEELLDLENSSAKLRKVIQDMTKIMKEQFEAQFNVINKNFGEVFKELLS